MRDRPAHFECDEEELKAIYRDVFHSLTNSNSWVNVSIDIQDDTPSMIVQNLNESSNSDRGINYLFRYSDTKYSKYLLELRIPSINTGDILIGSLSYRPNSEDMNLAFSSHEYKEINRSLISELIKNSTNFTLDKPSDEFSDSDLLWIKVNKEIETVEFDEILMNLEYIIDVVDEFYSKKLTGFVIEKASEFGNQRSRD